MRASFFGLGALAISATALAACSSSGDQTAPRFVAPSNGGTDDGNADVQLHPGTEVLPTDIVTGAKVSPDAIDFLPSTCAHLLKVPSGSIIVGDADGSAGNPKGFLRRVLAASCSSVGVHVTTAPATLQDAVDKLKLDWGFDIPACKDVKGPSLGVDYGGQLFAYTGDATTPAGQTVPFDASANIDMSLCLSPKLTVKADVEFLKLNSFEVSATGTMQAQSLLSASVKIDPSVPADVQADLAGVSLTKSISQTIVDKDISFGSFGVGPLSIPVSAHYSATVSCDLQFTAPVEVAVGAKANGSLTAGLTYDGEHLAPKTGDSFSFEPIPPTFTENGMMRAVCAIEPKIQLEMFGVATGEIAAKAYGGMGATQQCGDKDASGVTQRVMNGDLEAGASATATASVDLFGLVKWKKACTLFDESTSAHYDHDYPTPGGAGATCKVAGPFPLPPNEKPDLSSCFGDESGGGGGDAGVPLIPGTCTHDVCTSGDPLGQACDDCTMKVCAVDSYCCDTFWGASCFDDVKTLCGKTCP